MSSNAIGQSAPETTGTSIEISKEGSIDLDLVEGGSTDSKPSPNEATLLLKQRLDAITSTPTFTDYLSAYEAVVAEVQHTNIDTHSAWDVVVKRQNPTITKEEVAAIHMASRSALSAIYFNIAWRQRTYEQGKLITQRNEVHEFAFKDAKFFFKATPDKADKPHFTTRALAWDDVKLRSCTTYGERASASIADHTTRAGFYFAESNLLFWMMMLESEQAIGSRAPWHDLPVFLDTDGMTVMEKHEEWNGKDCVIVGNPAFQVWLCTDLNFAVVKFHQQGMSTDNKVTPVCLVSMDDFESFENGLWFPKSLARRYYDIKRSDCPLEKEDTLAVNAIRVNSDVEDNLFGSSIIPQGSYVFNSAVGATYIAGRNSDIGELLTDALSVGPVKSTRTAVWVLILSNLIACLVLFTLALWWRRKRSGV